MRLELALIVGILLFCSWCAYIVARMSSSVNVPNAPSATAAATASDSQAAQQSTRPARAPLLTEAELRSINHTLSGQMQQRSHLNQQQQALIDSRLQLQPQPQPQQAWPVGDHHQQQMPRAGDSSESPAARAPFQWAPYAGHAQQRANYAAAPAPAPPAPLSALQANGARSPWQIYAQQQATRQVPYHQSAAPRSGAAHTYAQQQLRLAPPTPVPSDQDSTDEDEATADNQDEELTGRTQDDPPAGSDGEPPSPAAALADEPMASEEDYEQQLPAGSGGGGDDDEAADEGDGDSDSESLDDLGRPPPPGPMQSELEEVSNRRSYDELESDSNERDKNGGLVVSRRRHLINGRPVAGTMRNAGRGRVNGARRRRKQQVRRRAAHARNGAAVLGRKRRKAKRAREGANDEPRQVAARRTSGTGGEPEEAAAEEADFDKLVEEIDEEDRLRKEAAARNGPPPPVSSASVSRRVLVGSGEHAPPPTNSNNNKSPVLERRSDEQASSASMTPTTGQPPLLQKLQGVRSAHASNAAGTQTAALQARGQPAKSGHRTAARKLDASAAGNKTNDSHEHSVQETLVAQQWDDDSAAMPAGGDSDEAEADRRDREEQHEREASAPEDLNEVGNIVERDAEARQLEQMAHHLLQLEPARALDELDEQDGRQKRRRKRQAISLAGSSSAAAGPAKLLVAGAKYDLIAAEQQSETDAQTRLNAHYELGGHLSASANHGVAADLDHGDLAQSRGRREGRAPKWNYGVDVAERAGSGQAGLNELRAAASSELAQSRESDHATTRSGTNREGKPAALGAGAVARSVPGTDGPEAGRFARRQARQLFASAAVGGENRTAIGAMAAIAAKPVTSVMAEGARLKPALNDSTTFTAPTGGALIETSDIVRGSEDMQVEVLAQPPPPPLSELSASQQQWQGAPPEAPASSEPELLPENVPPPSAPPLPPPLPPPTLDPLLHPPQLQFQPDMSQPPEQDFQTPPPPAFEAPFAGDLNGAVANETNASLEPEAVYPAQRPLASPSLASESYQRAKKSKRGAKRKSARKKHAKSHASKYKTAHASAKKQRKRLKKGDLRKKKRKFFKKQSANKKHFVGLTKGKKLSAGNKDDGVKKGATFLKDKGYRKKGFKRSYHKLETGDHKTYFDEFRDKDHSKKWKKKNDKHKYSQKKKWAGHDSRHLNEQKSKLSRGSAKKVGKWREASDVRRSKEARKFKKSKKSSASKSEEKPKH